MTQKILKPMSTALSAVSMFFKNQKHELTFWFTYPQENGEKTELADIHIGKFALSRGGEYASSSFRAATQYIFTPVRLQFYIPLCRCNFDSPP
jgi:hypothetical protein